MERVIQYLLFKMGIKGKMDVWGVVGTGGGYKFEMGRGAGI
jgi:hypothetical protein